MINRVIRHLVISDFFLNFAFGLLAPIFAIFILDNIDGSSLKVIGLATAFYWISRTLTTVPLSRFMDKTNGERDEFYFVIIGSFIMSTIPLFYILASLPWHVYLLQILLGLANSMAVPAWRILFTDHIDRGRTGYEWSLEDIAIGASVGASAYLGSIIADKFGFEIVFILLAILGYVATAFFLIPLKNDAKTLAQLKRAGRWASIKAKREELPPVIKSDGVQ
ncbi:MAG: MFS transporter [Candidatus Yanofskybacteria bacterium]|nr:MFS transporter [Candidatus Yanofskybacteria bacterium]